MTFMKITSLKEFSTIKRGDQFIIGGNLYLAIEDYEPFKFSVPVCCYKDYPSGRFDTSDVYQLHWDYVEHVLTKKTKPII